MEKACGAGRPARRNVKGRQRYGRCTGTGSGSPEEVFRMMKRKFVALLTAGLMTIGAGCAVFAEDVDFSFFNTVIKGQLTVGTEAGFAPYEYMVGDEVVGIDMDIAAKIAEKLGVELVVKNEAFDGALLEVQQGKVDLVAAGVSVSEERMKVMDFSDKYVDSKDVVVVKADKPAVEEATIDGLKGKVVGVQQGNIADLWVTDSTEAKSVQRYTQFVQAAQDLANGKIDAIVMDEAPAMELVAANDALMIMEGDPLFEDSYAIAIKKGNDQMTAAVNAVIAELKESGAGTESNDVAFEIDNTRHTILVVEDSAEMRYYLGKELSGDYNTLLASNGEEGLKIVQDFTDGIVHGLDDPDIILDVALVFPFEDVFLRHLVLVGKERCVVPGIGGIPSFPFFVRHGTEGILQHPRSVVLVCGSFIPIEFEVVEHGHVLFDPHPLLLHGGSAGGIIVIEGLRQREFNVLIQVQVLEVRHPGTVRGLVVDVKEEGFIFVPVLQEFDGMVGDQVRCISFFPDVLALGLGGLEYRIVILSLVTEHPERIETLGLAEHVPLSDDGSLVTGGLHELRNEGYRGVHDVGKHGLAVLVAVQTGHQAGAARRGKGVFDIGPVEPDALGGQPVDVGGRGQLGQGMAVGADGLERMVVTHDVDDVHPFAILRFLGGASRHRPNGSKAGRTEQEGNFNAVFHIG